LSRNRRRVVVTGMGVISAAGFGKDEFFDNLCSGMDMTGPIMSFNTAGFRRTNAAEIRRELPQTPENWKDHSRASRMALLAAKEALEDAGLAPDLSKLKAGICIGTMTGGAADFENWYCEEENREITGRQKGLIRQFPHKSVASALADEFKTRGCVNTIVSACASGTIALGTAYKLIKRGRADIVICGGADAFRKLQHLEASAFRIVSPDRVSPFDAKRKGILLGEGAGIIIFESEESAKKRKARIHCRVLGYGSSCDAYDLAHPQENGEGICLAMENAVREAGIPKEKIGYINAHGTGTVKNDSAEIAGIKKTFGKHAGNLLVSSIKGSIGHTHAAAGAVEAISTVMSIIRGKIPPTINYSNFDTSCDLNIVPNKAADMKPEAAASNSFGFGGNNAVIIFGVYDENEQECSRYRF